MSIAVIVRDPWIRPGWVRLITEAVAAAQTADSTVDGVPYGVKGGRLHLEPASAAANERARGILAAARGRRRGKCRPTSAASWRTFGRRSRCCAPSALNRSGSARSTTRQAGATASAIAACRASSPDNPIWNRGPLAAITGRGGARGEQHGVGADVGDDPHPLPAHLGVPCGRQLDVGDRALPVSAGGRVKTAVQLLLPEMDGIAGFYEAHTDRVLCVRCAGRPTPAGTPIPEPDCGDLHCSRCRQPLRRVKRRDEPAAAAGLFA